MKSTTKAFLIGAAVALIAPLLLDLLLFGTIKPCHTVKTYEDGSSIQSCEVRN